MRRVADPQDTSARPPGPARWPASNRNGGRHQFGDMAGIKSVRLAGFRRNLHRSSVDCIVNMGGFDFATGTADSASLRESGRIEFSGRTPDALSTVRNPR